MTASHERDANDLVDGLVELARTDRNAFGELFDHFYPPIFNYCLRRLIRRAPAEDVASQVFFKVARVIRKFPGRTTEDFRRWLFRIATNEVNTYLKNSIRQQELISAAALLGRVADESSPSFAGNLDAIDWDEVYVAIGNLSEREQAIVTLRFFAEQPTKQIAATLDMKPGTVRVALSRAVAKLRADLRRRETKSAHKSPPTVDSEDV